MSSALSKEFYLRLSLYLDGRLTDNEIKDFESYLSAHPEAQEELEAFKGVQRMLHDKQRLESNEWLWSKISGRLPGEDAKGRVLPFSQKAAPFAIVASVMVVLVIVGTLYYQRDLVSKYFFTKKAEVSQLYQNGLLKGSVLPLFNHLSNDQVLQFALFGTLPVDSKTQTSLHVDENANKGYRIEFTKSRAPTAHPVSVRSFCDQIGMRPDQQQMIDSMLDIARRKIQASVFVGENNSLAIHTGLVKLNQLLVSNIAASLEQGQRVRFRKYLEENQAPYTFVADHSPAISGEHLLHQIARLPRTNDFFVVTPDTLAVSRIGLDIDSLQQHMAETSPDFNGMEARVQALMQHLRALEMHQEHFAVPFPGFQRFGFPNNDVSFNEGNQDNGTFTVKIVPRTSPAVVSSHEETSDFNGPDSGFFFEFGTDDSVRFRFFTHPAQREDNGENVISLPGGVAPSPMQMPQGLHDMQTGHRIDLDSALSGFHKHYHRGKTGEKNKKKSPIEL
jgi:hypothetical protein